MNQEQWRPIAGYEGSYEISDHGRVKSLERTVTTSAGVTRRVRGRIMKTTVGGHGYPTVSLFRDGTRHTRNVHNLVAEAFIGRRPASGIEIRHLDGDRLNCNLSNLRYGTPQENQADKREHGRNTNLNRTHCPFGHELVEWNCYDQSRSRYGRRQCIACSRGRAHIRYNNLPKSMHQKTSDDYYRKLAADNGFSIAVSDVIDGDVVEREITA